MYCFLNFKIAIPHFYCLEYYEDDKKMIVEMDFREKFFELSPQIITHWERPYDNIELSDNEKTRILLNIKKFLETNFSSRQIIMEDS